MPSGPSIWNRTRVRFAAVGAVACLLAALFGELVFSGTHTGQDLRKYHLASLLFPTEPVTTTRTVAPPARPDGEMQRRLEENGAQSGEVQVSLAWNNYNDLDLSVTEPSGETIDGYNQSSRSGGVLDLDMNPTDDSAVSSVSRAMLIPRETNINRARRSAYSVQPVENIVWPVGRAPNGHYKVYVNQFCNKERTDQTPYWVEVRVHGQVKRINGVMGKEDFAQQQAPAKLTYEFDVAPAPAVIPVQPAPPVATAQHPHTLTNTAYSISHLSTALLAAGFWGLLLGLLPLCLLYAQRLYLEGPLWKAEQDFSVGVGAPSAGFLLALLAQLFFSLIVQFAPAGFAVAHVLLWALLGGLLGWLFSLLTPNLPRLPAAVCGLLSGAIGSAALQFAFAGHVDSAGRVFSATLFGGAIGVLIALPERVKAPKIEPTPPPVEEPPGFERQPPFVVRSGRLRPVGGLRRPTRSDRP